MNGPIPPVKSLFENGGMKLRLLLLTTLDVTDAISEERTDVAAPSASGDERERAVAVGRTSERIEPTTEVMGAMSEERPETRLGMRLGSRRSGMVTAIASETEESRAV